MSYGDLLRDPRWQKKRLEMLDAAGWKCKTCGSGEKTLNVHHRKYRSGAKPWEYENTELDVLCEDCHAALHRLRPRLDAVLENLTSPQLMHVLGYAQTILSGQNEAMGVQHALVSIISHDQARGIVNAIESLCWEQFTRGDRGEGEIVERGLMGLVDLIDLWKEAEKRWKSAAPFKDENEKKAG